MCAASRRRGTDVSRLVLSFSPYAVTEPLGISQRCTPDPGPCAKPVLLFRPSNFDVIIYYSRRCAEGCLHLHRHGAVRTRSLVKMIKSLALRPCSPNGRALETVERSHRDTTSLTFYPPFDTIISRQRPSLPRYDCVELKIMPGLAYAKLSITTLYSSPDWSPVSAIEA